MAIKKGTGEKVDRDYIDGKYHEKAVLILYSGEKLPAGEGYIAYYSDARDLKESEADADKLRDILMQEHNGDGLVVVGYRGCGVSFIL
jgi:hypothetical protein